MTRTDAVRGRGVGPINWEEVSVTINRGGRKLGLNLEGGSGDPQIPHTQVSPPTPPPDCLYITPPLGPQIRGLVPGGLAEKDGGLKVGDRLVSVNGKDLVGLSYKDVIDLVTRAEDPITFVIRRYIQVPSDGPSIALQQRAENAPSAGAADYSPASLARAQLNGLKVVEVCKGPTGLGMLVSGSDTAPYDPITVKDVVHLGPADKTGRIRPGDVILKVNAQSFESIAVSEARSALKELPQGTVKLFLKECETNTPSLGSKAARK